MEHVFYNDNIYHLCQGYFRRRNGQLHTDVWIAHNGPIPKGMLVHHKNLDKTDNDIDNLQLMTIGEHTSLHHQLGSIHCKPKLLTDKIRKTCVLTAEQKLKKNEYQRLHRPSRSNLNITEEQRLKRTESVRNCRLKGGGD